MSNIYIKRGLRYKDRIRSIYCIICTALIYFIFAPSQLFGQCDFAPNETITLNQSGGTTDPSFTNKYALTDFQGNIIEVADNPNFSGQSAGVYVVYNINFETTSGIHLLAAGNPINSVTGTCFKLSAPLAIQVCNDPSEICDLLGNENIQASTNGGTSSPDFSNQYVLTDYTGTILEVNDTQPLFNGQAAGAYLVYNINYLTTDGITGLNQGSNIVNVTSSSGNACYELSNPLAYSVCNSLELADLALEFTIGSSGPYRNGHEIEYHIKIINQGSVPAQDIDLALHYSCGLDLDETLTTNVNWSTISPGLASSRVATGSVLNPGDSLNTSIVLTLSSCVNNSAGFDAANTPYLAIAEIAAANDDSGNPLADIDSDYDYDPYNDSGGIPNSNDDDRVDDDGTVDEDDHDPALIDVFDLAIQKTLLIDNTTPIVPGGMVTFQIELFNQGNVDAFNINFKDIAPEGMALADPDWSVSGDVATMINPIDSLAASESTTFEITYQILDESSIGEIMLFIEIIEVSLRNGSMAIDIDSDLNSEDNNSPSNTNDNDIFDDTGGDDFDPVVICVNSTINCPEPVELVGCHSQDEIDNEIENWLTQFSGGGCSNTGVRFVESVTAPPVCGGSVTANYEMYDIQSGNALVGQSCAVNFVVRGDNIAPSINGSVDMNFQYSAASCDAPYFTSSTDVTTLTNASVSDNCSDNLVFTLVNESLLPEDPSDIIDESYFQKREAIRTYTITDECGNTSQTIEQIITYEIESCNNLTHSGFVSIEGGNTLTVPPGCTPPGILEATAVAGACGPVEYMWMVSTRELAPGVPYIPTPRNLGRIWFIIPDEYGPELQNMQAITQNTYFVRCVRNLSCTNYLESNIIGITVDANAECMEVPNVLEDCDNEIKLIAPQANLDLTNTMEYRTNKYIDAQNSIQSGKLILNAKQGTNLKPGFEVSNRAAELEVKTDGCDN